MTRYIKYNGPTNPWPDYVPMQGVVAERLLGMGEVYQERPAPGDAEPELVLPTAEDPILQEKLDRLYST